MSQNTDENQDVLDKLNNLENEVKASKRKNKVLITILILMIIGILIICLLKYRIGQIGYTPTSVQGENDLDIISVTDDDTKWNINTELDIFKNEKFNGEKIIAPHGVGLEYILKEFKIILII